MSPRVETRELRAALEEIFGKPLIEVRRTPSVYSSSASIEELELSFSDGGRLAAMFKNLAPAAVVESARGVRPAFLCDSQREIHVYQSILAPLDLGTPRLYGAVRERSWLFIEKVDAPELYQHGDFDAWLGTARWLGRFHACTPASAETLVPNLVRYDAAYYRRWQQRAGLGLGGYEQTLETLLELPAALIHGDFYPSNILTGGGRICPVDWEMAAVGPGLFDVAALASGKWRREQRLAMAEAYCLALPERLRPRDWVHAFDCCQLQLALQWLGWAEGWVPPPEHVHDWLGEAMTLSGTPKKCLVEPFSNPRS